jgi:hypothetical protein
MKNNELEYEPRYIINEVKPDGTIEQGRNLWDYTTAFGFCAHLNREYSGRKFYVITVHCRILSNGTLGVVRH